MLSRREQSLLRALTTRGGRRRSEFCRCEGVRAVRELVERRPDLLVLIAATSRGVEALGFTPPELRLVEEKDFGALSCTVNTQGVMALARIPAEKSGIPEGKFILVLDKISDPGNFGTMARTLLAVGGKELWLTKGTVDPWCDKALRSGMGAQFSLGIRAFNTLTEASETAAGYGFRHIFYADPHQGESCFECPDLYDNSLLIIGGEANGSSDLPPGTRSVRIPMPGNYESLNAAQAATVLLVESVRRSNAEKRST